MPFEKPDPICTNKMLNLFSNLITKPQSSYLHIYLLTHIPTLYVNVIVYSVNSFT